MNASIRYDFSSFHWPSKNFIKTKKVKKTGNEIKLAKYYLIWFPKIFFLSLKMLNFDSYNCHILRFCLFVSLTFFAYFSILYILNIIWQKRFSNHHKFQLFKCLINLKLRERKKLKFSYLTIFIQKIVFQFVTCVFVNCTWANLIKKNINIQYGIYQWGSEKIDLMQRKRGKKGGNSIKISLKSKKIFFVKQKKDFICSGSEIMHIFRQWIEENESFFGLINNTF